MTMKSPPSLSIIIAIVMLASMPNSASANSANSANSGCRLCSDDEKNDEETQKNEIPLRINITTHLNFSRAALTGRGSGSIAVDENNGEKRVSGQLIDLGGYAVAGSVLITGEPGREIYVDLPRDIIMRSDRGGKIDIQSLRTDLPVSPRLDLAGELRFSFGGNLVVSGDASGQFRGRIPITANYE